MNPSSSVAGSRGNLRAIELPHKTIGTINLGEICFQRGRILRADGDGVCGQLHRRVNLDVHTDGELEVGADTDAGGRGHGIGDRHGHGAGVGQRAMDILFIRTVSQSSDTACRRSGPRVRSVSRSALQRGREGAAAADVGVVDRSREILERVHAFNMTCGRDRTVLGIGHGYRVVTFRQRVSRLTALRRGRAPCIEIGVAGQRGAILRCNRQAAVITATTLGLSLGDRCRRQRVHDDGTGEGLHITGFRLVRGRLAGEGKRVGEGCGFRHIRCTGDSHHVGGRINRVERIGQSTRLAHRHGIHRGNGHRRDRLARAVLLVGCATDGGEGGGRNDGDFELSVWEKKTLTSILYFIRNRCRIITRIIMIIFRIITMRNNRIVIICRQCGFIKNQCRIVLSRITAHDNITIISWESSPTKYWRLRNSCCHIRITSIGIDDPDRVYSRQFSCITKTNIGEFTRSITCTSCKIIIRIRLGSSCCQHSKRSFGRRRAIVTFDILV